MQIDSLNYVLALGTLLLQIVTAGLFVAFFMRKREGFRGVADMLGRHGLWLGFLISLVSMLIALYYSDILGVEPCYWCYWQRYLLFPQVILLGMAAWKKDVYMADYSIVLSFIGGAIALYHHALQMLPGSGLPCPAVGVSCAQRFLFEFGYITFPLMAFTTFAFLIVVMLFVRSSRKVD